MILVDTSVWIAYLRGDSTTGAQRLHRALERDHPVALTCLIAQEVLQGVATSDAFARLEAYLATQRRLEPRDPWAASFDAARIYAACRTAGVTIRSSIDCLIAQIAIEHDVPLLHEDRDFERIASVVDKLKVY